MYLISFKLSSFKKAIAYYKSCLDTKAIDKRGTKPLEDLLKEYGSWTLTTDDWKEESWDMIKYLALMRRKLSLGPLFTVFVGADPRNSSVNIIQVSSVQTKVKSSSVLSFDLVMI